MTDATIRAALEAAAEDVSAELVRQEMSGDHDEPGANLWVAAAAVAAFLRALPDHAAARYGHELAAAVEEVARDA